MAKARGGEAPTRYPISFKHAEQVAGLPNHHTDLFDGMLIAQSLVEGLTLVTRDRQFEPYRGPVIWA